MNKKFTKLMAAFALLIFMMPTMVGWGQTRESVTVSYGWETTDDAALWTISEAIVATSGQGNTGSYAGKINTNSTTVQFNEKVYVTAFSYAFKRTSNNNNYSVYIETSTDGSNWSIKDTQTMNTFSNGSYRTVTKEFDGSQELYVRFRCNNTTAVRYVDDVTITYATSSSQLDPCDLTLTNTSTSLVFDLYNNTNPYVINYTTSSTGVVTVSDNDYITAVVDQTNKTITVTPIAITNGAKVITVNQAADDDYAAGSKTFTINITDSTPYVQPTTIEANLNNALFGTNYSGTASGITDENPVVGTLNRVTITYAGSGNHYINDSQIRFYPNNKLTFDAPSGYEITQIVFTSAGTWAATISADNGTYNSSTKTWTGSETSVLFTGSGSSRCDMSKATITLAVISSAVATTTTINVPQNFNTDIYQGTNAGTLTATVKDNEDNTISGATVTWSSSNTGVATIDANGAVTLVAVGTTTITASYAGVEDQYRPSEDTYELTVIDNTPLANIAALTAQTVAGNYDVSLSNAVVTYVNGNYAYIQDASGAVVMYKSGHGLTAGDVLNGTATVAYQLRNNNPQITSISGVTPVSGTAPNPTEVAASSWNYTFNNVLSQYFKVTGATITSSNNKYYISLGGEDVQLYGQGDAYNFSITNLSTTYTIIGFPTLYNDTKELQIFVVPTAEASTTPSVSVTNATLSVLAAGANGSIEVTYENIDENDIDPEARFFAEDGTTAALYNWITISFDANNDILYQVAANNGEARTAYFKVYEQSEGVYSNLVTVTQNAYVPTPTGGNYIRITSLDQLTDGSFVVIASRYDTEHTNEYYAMTTTLASGKATGVSVTSTTSGSSEFLAASNVDNNTYWVVNVTSNGYTFTNANNETISWGSSTNFSYTSSNTEWTIERNTAGSTTMVPGYTGFTIVNFNEEGRAFAKNESHNFGPYSTSNYTGNDAYKYNFYLDIFVQTSAPVTETYTLNIAKHGTTTENGGWHLIASPVLSVTPSVNNGFIAETAANYDLFYFDQTQGLEWRNYKQTTFNLVSGKGYLYASGEENGTTLTFTGEAYNGNGQVGLTYSTSNPDANMHGWNLIGNPFGTAATVDLPYYKMNNNGSALSTSIEGGQVAAMEGVFVYAYDEDEGAIEAATFTKVIRSADASQSIVNLNVEHNRGNVVDNAIIRFDEGRTLPKFMFNEDDTKLYFSQNGKDYAIVRAQAQGTMPVNFKANQNGQYTLSVNPEGVKLNYLHLIDNMTGNDVDLLATPSYSFNAKTTDYESRFKLVFVCGDGASTDSETFAFYSNGSYVINNEGEATLQVIDINGRILKSESINGCANINVNATQGIYMLRLVNGDNVKVQKVVVR